MQRRQFLLSTAGARAARPLPTSSYAVPSTWNLANGYPATSLPDIGDKLFAKTISETQIDINRGILKDRGVEEIQNISDELQMSFESNSPLIINNWLASAGKRAGHLLDRYQSA